MVVCQYCGRENPQPDAAYCQYCGSSLRQQQPQQAVASPTPSSTATTWGYRAPRGSTIPSPNLSERYEKVLAQVEMLGGVVIILALVTLILVFL